VDVAVKAKYSTFFSCHGLETDWSCFHLHSVCVCVCDTGYENVCGVGCLFSFLCKPSFNCKMLHYVLIHTDLSSISENTVGSTPCVQYHTGCRCQYLYLYREGAITIRAEDKLDCPVQLSYISKLFVISRLHSSFNIPLVIYVIISVPLLLIFAAYFCLSPDTGYI
jgi:hypothetical protein